MDSNSQNTPPADGQPVQPVVEPNPLQGAPAVPPPEAANPEPVVSPLVGSDPAGVGITNVQPAVSVSPLNPSTAGPGAVSSPTAANMPPVEKKSNMMLIVLAILGILLAVGISGGVYWYMNKQNQASTNDQSNTSNTQTVQEVSNLGKEVQSLETVNVDTEFVDVDRDLQTL